MIIYKRLLRENDVKELKKDEQLIYYYSNNIAYTINPLDTKGYAVRRKKVFNNEITDDKIVKTVKQVLKVVES